MVEKHDVDVLQRGSILDGANLVSGTKDLRLEKERVEQGGEV